MREIKFRAWNGKKMRGIEKNDFFSIRNDGEISIQLPDTDFSIPLMQFTGIKDINGVECFDGDIVEIYSEHPAGNVGMTGLVKFLDGQYVVDSGYGSEHLFRDDCAFIIEGNIHQNPELLENK